MLAGEAAAIILDHVAPRPDAHQGVLRLVVVGCCEINLVGGNDRQRARVGQIEELALDLQLLPEPVALDLDVQAIAEGLLQTEQARPGVVLLALAQSAVDRAIGASRQDNQAVTELRKPLDVDMRHLLRGRIKERARGELHQILIAGGVAGQQRDHPGGIQSDLTGADARGSAGFRVVPKMHLEAAANDRLHAHSADLVREFERTEQISRVRERNCEEIVRGSKLRKLGDGDCALQQRVGRVHLEVHKGGARSAGDGRRLGFVSNRSGHAAL